MDDCPECGASCLVRTAKSDKRIFICWDCHISWRSPQDDHGRRVAQALPGSVVSVLG